MIGMALEGKSKANPDSKGGDFKSNAEKDFLGKQSPGPCRIGQLQLGTMNLPQQRKSIVLNRLLEEVYKYKIKFQKKISVNEKGIEKIC